MAIRKLPNPADAPAEKPNEEPADGSNVATSENSSKTGGGVDSPDPSDAETGLEADDGSEGTRARVAPPETGSEANDPAAPRNSVGAQTLTGEGSEADEVKTDPPLSTATAPTSDRNLKPNPNESIPTHTVGMGDVEKTARSGYLEPGEEVHVTTGVDYFSPTVALDLTDPIATQQAHMNGGSLTAVGEGRRVDPRTVTGQQIYNLADAGQIGKIKEGDQFYALWMFNPGTDSIRWRNDHINDLVAGRLSRNGLPASYWRDHSATRPPLCERTASGFKILD